MSHSVQSHPRLKGAWWRVLTKRGPLEQGTANNSVFLPQESHEHNKQGSLACCSPWGCRVRHYLATEQQTWGEQLKNQILTHRPSLGEGSITADEGR